MMEWRVNPLRRIEPFWVQQLEEEEEEVVVMVMVMVTLTVGWALKKKEALLPYNT